MKMDFNYNKGLFATRELQQLVQEKGVRLSGKQVVLLMNEDLAACTV
jgi:hypothetical protein